MQNEAGCEALMIGTVEVNVEVGEAEVELGGDAGLGGLVVSAMLVSRLKL